VGAAREAFVDAMSTASVIVAVVAALGALIAWLHLPGRAAGRRAEAASTAPSPGR
jgi:hypothetical protein